MTHETKKWWMSEDALEQAPERAAAAPEDAPERELGRRGFLKRMGFGAAVAATACAAPSRQALPFVDQPETVTPGASTTYASTCGGCAAACGLLVEVRDGRPIKVEGNPSHPMSGGGVCATGHAAPMALYDESRPLRPTIGGDTVGWTRFDREVRAAIESARSDAKQIVLVTGEIPRSSPSTRLLIDRFTARTGARHVAFEPLGQSAIARAHEQSHGVRAVPDYRFDEADVVASFGADFLGTWIAPVTFARRWAAGRRPDRVRRRMSRVYQLEGRMSLTGTNADERIRLAPSERYAVLAALARRVARLANAPERAELEGALSGAGSPVLDERTLDRIAADLYNARERALVVSDSSELRDQLLVNAINEHLRAYGRTVDLANARPTEAGAELAEAIEAMERGEVGVLVTWDANPAYASPLAARLRAAMERVPTTVAITDRRSETAEASRFVAPETHAMEGWSDAEPRVGVVAIRQPTFRPIRAQQPGQERLMRWIGERGAWVDALRRSWARNVFPQSGNVWFTGFWDSTVQSGVVELRVPRWAQPDGSEPRYGERVATPMVAPADEDAPPPAYDAARALEALRAERAPERGEGSFELVAHADISVGTGRDANNPWLQEAPDPITKVVWDNFVSVSRTAAAELGVALGDVVRVSAGGASIEAPVVVQPGQHDRVISVALGYGRTAAGPVGDGVGADAWPLLAAGQPDARNATLQKTGEHRELARNQWELDQHGREFVREASFAEHLADARAGNPPERHGPPMYQARPRTGRRWGMAIDLSACIGCQACLVSCQVENNIPVVGQDEVLRFRDMHWMRIDRYFGGDPDDPDVVHQPMLCQHCDIAPCETVCPALATMQSSEGLNQMIYNRCVGTRYCGNNCPFKVRRFNWFDYSREPAANLALNPDVVVRTRGVMEKCSFCVQRIQEARWTARLEDRELRDGDVRTACQQSCPTQAISFGDMNDPESEISHRKADPRAYRLLADVHVQPVVHYLTRIRNREEG